MTRQPRHLLPIDRAITRWALLDRYAAKLRARRATITRLAEVYREAFTRHDRREIRRGRQQPNPHTAHRGDR